MADWSSLERTEQKLATDWDEIRQKRSRLLRELIEADERMARIEKQREMFRARAADMLRRGLRSLDELEAAEEKEREEAEKEGVATAAVPHSEPINLSDPELDPSLVEAISHFDPSDSFWADLDFGGGTMPTMQGSH